MAIKINGKTKEINGKIERIGWWEVHYNNGDPYWSGLHDNNGKLIGYHKIYSPFGLKKDEYYYI